MTQTETTASAAKRTNILLSIAVSLGIAYLLMSERYRMMANPDNRYSIHWNNMDSVQLMLAVLVLGAVVFGIWQIVSRFGGKVGQTLGRVALVGTAGAVAVGKLHVWSSPPYEVFGESFTKVRTPICSAMFAAVVLLAVLAAIPRFPKIAKVVQRICVVMFVVFVAELVQSTGWTGHRSAFPETPADLPTPMAFTGETPKPDVLVLLFDSWSWDFTFGQGVDHPDVVKRLPNLCGLIQESTYYTDAHSLANHTTESIPRMLYQTDDEYKMLPDGNWIFENRVTHESSEPEDRMNLFQVMQNHGYRTFFAGWGPWDSAFEQGLDSRLLVQVYPFAQCKYTFAGSVFYHLGNGLLDLAQSIAGPLQCRWRTEFLWRGQVNREFVKLTEDVQAHTLNVIRDYDDPTFSIMFHGVPHFPFIFNADGVRGPLDKLTGVGCWVNWTHPSADEFEACLPNYIENVAYVDTLIGEIVDTLKETGKYDNTLLIITSDHAYYHPRKGLTFESDEALHEYRTHVPLIVKMPHQESGEVVTEHTTMLELGPMIAEAIEAAEVAR